MTAVDLACSFPTCPPCMAAQAAIGGGGGGGGDEEPLTGPNNGEAQMLTASVYCSKNVLMSVQCCFNYFHKHLLKKYLDLMKNE